MDLRERAKDITAKINVDRLHVEARELEVMAEKPDFWRDHGGAAKKMQKLAVIQEEIKKLEELNNWLKEQALGASSKQPGASEIAKLVEELETKLYLSGQYDSGSAVVSIHSGQGGVEAMDWAEMLHRMYLRFCERKRFQVEEIDFQPGEEAGIKEVVFQVKGDNAYGLLKHEAGVHRLVRQSPFNADHLRQTSFALVEVIPLVDQGDQGSKIEINDSDLEWDFFRSGGKGGQNVNKVSTAVRVMHRPTGIVVTSQKERSQEQNRNLALKILQGKLVQIEEDKRKEEELRLKGQHLTPGWGNQIRSYVLHPYHLVKDLRTEYEETDADAVLDGRLDSFVEQELSYFRSYAKV